MNGTLKVYLVDDHSLFREGLKFLLSNDSLISKIYEAKNGKECIDNLLRVKPDIILMDIDMPVMNGIEATKEARRILPESKIIALSMYANENFYAEMIDAGAKGFLLKNSKFEDVQKAIRIVHEGKNYFSFEILESIIKNLNRKKQAFTDSELTDREIEVLYNICK